ncbi:hypothetical protein [Paraburkholderia sp.]|uniref:hypothetical protein n=1 Tax=Paraburkholderia sp. TaxID=1926495 RepID=UPI00239E4A93|nr:hypothetical protein [Paraburkholderia sp.]MDE1182424.1 hypothetical protein [Paraburkholderia sp.]
MKLPTPASTNATHAARRTWNSPAIDGDQSGMIDTITLCLVAATVIILALTVYVAWPIFAGLFATAADMLKNVLAFSLGLGIPAIASISAHRTLRDLRRERAGERG